MFMLSGAELASIHQRRRRPCPQPLHTTSFITSVYADTIARQLRTNIYILPNKRASN